MVKKCDEIQGNDETKLPKKSVWSSQIEFILSCVGYTVGLGNIWRFPYVCVQNGGGAFLIPYFIFLFICGMPLLLMEFITAQYSGFGVTEMWNMCPIFKGLGVGMTLSSLICCVYLNVIFAWIVYYLIMSCGAVLPWTNCNNSWNTVNCNDTLLNRTSTNNLLFSKNDDITTIASTTTIVPNNTLDIVPHIEIINQNSFKEFWLYNVLNISSGIEETGSLNLHLVICSLVAWLIVCLCIIRGVKSIGKVIYVTALLPYVLLTIIFVRGVTLPGSSIGLQFYLRPKWETLATFKVWIVAATQIFYSLGPVWGGMITMASFNRFDHNIIRETFTISFTGCLTSFFGGLSVFSVLGYMAYSSNVSSIENLLDTGPGLAFVVYPQALSLLPDTFGPTQLWSFLFFFMLFITGLDSQFGSVETILINFFDAWPHIFFGKRKIIATIAFCVICWLLAFPFITQGGIYLFQIIDWYTTAFCVLLFAFLECTVIAYFYGIANMYRNVKEMLGYFPKSIYYYFVACWCFVTPASIAVMFVRSVIIFEAPKFNETYVYPPWAINFGKALSVVCLIPIPAYALYYVYRKRHALSKSSLIRPNLQWRLNSEQRKLSVKPYQLSYDDELLRQSTI